MDSSSQASSKTCLGVTQAIGGKMPFMDLLIKVLQEEVQEFAWEVKILSALDYYLPQNRIRVFLRGMRVETLGEGTAIPAVLKPFGRKALADILDPSLPAQDPQQLTARQQQNLKDILARLKEDKASGKINEDMHEVAVFPLDRAQGKVYKQRYFLDKRPTSTCHNVYLFVVSIRDLGKARPRFFRFFHPGERLRLQGFDSEIAEDLPSDARVTQFRCSSRICMASSNTWPRSTWMIG